MVSNRIIIRHGAGTPTSKQLINYELGYSTDEKSLYINNNGEIEKIGNNKEAVEETNKRLDEIEQKVDKKVELYIIEPIFSDWFLDENGNSYLTISATEHGFGTSARVLSVEEFLSDNTKKSIIFDAIYSDNGDIQIYVETGDHNLITIVDNTI